jgi:hypothetical protein
VGTPMFVIPHWHKPYAEVLLVPDSPNLDTLIKEAERAIFARYLEICASSPAPQAEESVDLENAVSVLSRLKKRKLLA